MSTLVEGGSEYAWSRRVRGLESSAIREILRVVNREDVISFAGGLPAPELFPTELLARLASDLFAAPEGRQALQYGGVATVLFYRRGSDPRRASIYLHASQKPARSS